MQRHETDWTQIKNLVQTSSWVLSAVPDDGGHLVYASNGTMTYETYLSTGSSDHTEMLTFNPNTGISATELPPFGSKKLPNGQSLFRRIHGLKLDLDTSGSDQKVTFTVPYGSAKITSTEIIGASLGDRIDFKVLDTASGTVTTVPNYMLNQFGFDVYPSEGRYEQKSEYDADLFLGLQLEITVKPMDSVARPVYFNLVLHEVV